MNTTEKPDTGIIRWGILNKKSSRELEMIFSNLFIKQAIFQHIKESGSIFIKLDILFAFTDTA